MDWYEWSKSILIELEASQAWHDILTQLHSTTGGGPAIAALASRAVVLCRRDIQRNTTNSTTKCVVEALHEICWEKLHTGCWRDVPCIWRDAYSAACILTAVLEGVVHLDQDLTDLTEGVHCGAGALKEKSALRHLDMAALMGGTALRPFIDSYITQIQRHLCSEPSPAALAGIEDPLNHSSETLNNEEDDFYLVSTTKEKGEEKIQQQDLNQGAVEMMNRLPNNFPPGSRVSHQASTPQIESLPSLERFAAEYYGTRPVVILDAMASWPALQRWRSAAYLRAVAGPRTVPVEIGRHYLAEGWGQQLMLFSDFLENSLLRKEKVNDEDIVYLAQHELFDQIPALGADIREPEYCALSSSGVAAVNVWMGPSGTITPAHTDPYHNLLCQVVGRKYIRLYPPSATAALYPNEGLMDNTSRVDVDAPDTAQFPLFNATPYIDYVLLPGQMLYIPPKWWHYVKSLSTSISVSFWWK